MAKDRRNVLRLRRGRLIGLSLIGIMGFLLFGFVFLVDEPQQIQIQADDPVTPEDEEIVIELEPIDPFEVPVPVFEPRTIALTPIITLIDDFGNQDVTRGETTFLTFFTGLEITTLGTNATYDNGRIQIDLEFDTNDPDPEQISGTYLLNVDPVGLHTRTTLQPTETVDEIATIQIYDVRIDQIVTNDGDTELTFTLEQLDINLDPVREIPIPPASVQRTPDFILTQPVQIYNVVFSKTQTTMVEEQTINQTEIVVEEVVTEDTPFVPCPDVKDDSISILFPSIGVSGTSALWDKTPEGFDIINVDIRNNRNCDLTLAIGSQWQRVNGQIFTSKIEEFLVPTNATQPFSSIPFDSRMDCNAGSCAGQEIQWCFIAKATVDDVTEIVDPFCGKKFYR